jgi:hypothetical protein
MYGLVISISIDIPLPSPKVFSVSARLISGMTVPFLSCLPPFRPAVLTSPMPKSSDLCLSLASSLRSFRTCRLWRTRKMASATLRGMTMPSTIGKVVLLELLTDFWHTGLASSGAQDFAGKADEVVAGCGSLLTIAGARPKSK